MRIPGIQGGIFKFQVDIPGFPGVLTTMEIYIHKTSNITRMPYKTTGRDRTVKIHSIMIIGRLEPKYISSNQTNSDRGNQYCRYKNVERK